MSKLENEILRLLAQNKKKSLTREKKLLKELLKIYDDCRKELYIQFLEAKGKQDTLRLEHLEGTIRDIEKQIKYYTKLAAKARQKAVDEAFLLGQELGAGVLLAGGVNISTIGAIGKINSGMVEALIGDIPKLSGKVETDLLFRIRDELTRGAIMGESIPKIAKRVFGTGITQEGMKKPFKSIETRCEVIARTEMIKASDAGYEDLAARVEDIIGEELFDAWITARDERVDAECRAIENGANPNWKSIDGHPGVYKRGEGPRPVLNTHPRCRCRRIPFLLSWEENGDIKLDNLRGDGTGPEKKRTKSFSPTKPAHEVEIERLLKDAPMQERKKLAEHLLSETGNNIPVRVIKMKQSAGYHKFNIGLDGKIQSMELALKSDDVRPQRYQIKTVFHEVTHSKANGTVSDINKIGDAAYRDVEETVAETVAYYMTRKAGITEELVPSYVSKMINNLPKLKRLPEFKNCKKNRRFWRDFCQVSI